jgi:hypothetical protein
VEKLGHVSNISILHELFLKSIKEGKCNPEDCLPIIEKKVVKDSQSVRVVKKSTKECHDPLTSNHFRTKA